MAFRLNSLQHRLSIFLLLPVAVLLLLMGYLSFIYARNNLLAQFKEASLLKLERAGDRVDRRLREPKRWMQMFHSTADAPNGRAIRRWMIQQLETLPGVERVSLSRYKPQAGTDENSDKACSPPSGPSPCFTWERGHGNRWRQDMDAWTGMDDFHHAEIGAITQPRYDDLVEHQTVSMVSELLDKQGHPVGRLEMVLKFHYLIEGTPASQKTAGIKDFLVTDEGTVLTCNVTDVVQRSCYGPALQSALIAMKKENTGTIISPVDSHNEVVGFHKLKEAPWSLIVVAPSDVILVPIYHFRTIFFGGLGVFILLILVLIRVVAGRTVSSIKTVSTAASRVAQGHFEALPPPSSGDEVGQLTRSFNEMVYQLNERIRLKEALDLAMRVQQSLLPAGPPAVAGMDIAGESLYCDETGGDYFDFITFPEWDSDRVGIAVGDVAGHGISAALFMTTVRALLRSRITQPGSLAEVICHVNRLLCMDTADSGDFMTLFLALVEPRTGVIRWIRAGHAPGILYDRTADRFEELSGRGMALGFDDSCPYNEYTYSGWNGDKVLFLGTDGIWEAENPQGEMYGMERLKAAIRENADRSSREIIEAVMASVVAFRETVPQEDDITVVVARGIERKK